jgi:hypothetical protein
MRVIVSDSPQAVKSPTMPTLVVASWAWARLADDALASMAPAGLKAVFLGFCT